MPCSSPLPCCSPRLFPYLRLTYRHVLTTHCACLSLFFCCACLPLFFAVHVSPLSHGVSIPNRSGVVNTNPQPSPVISTPCTIRMSSQQSQCLTWTAWTAMSLHMLWSRVPGRSTLLWCHWPRLRCFRMAAWTAAWCTGDVCLAMGASGTSPPRGGFQTLTGRSSREPHGRRP